MTSSPAGLDPVVRELLVCPKCRGDLLDVRSKGALEGLACPSCHLLYPVVEGVPWLVEDRARAYSG